MFHKLEHFEFLIRARLILPLFLSTWVRALLYISLTNNSQYLSFLPVLSTKKALNHVNHKHTHVRTHIHTSLICDLILKFTGDRPSLIKIIKKYFPSPLLVCSRQLAKCSFHRSEWDHALVAPKSFRIQEFFSSRFRLIFSFL